MFEGELKKLKELYSMGAFKPEFYAKKITSVEQLKNYDAFRSIPFTYKSEIRDTSVEERTTTSPEDIYGIFSSSGTTGEKTFYIYNRNDKRVHEKFVKTFYEELGVAEKDIGAIMAPVDTGVMAHTMMWQFTTMGAAYVNCPIPSPENIIDTIQKVPVTIIATRPSIATNVAYNPTLKKIAQQSHVNKLLLGGGFLSEGRRKVLEDVWHADCYNMFGMSEVFGPMAGECRRKRGLHYLNDYLMIEILDPKSFTPVENGKPGVAVYTTLWDKGFPLLRYWTDDVMIIDQTQCACGSKYPRLLFQGRLGDCFELGGKYVFPENVENILFKYGNIGEYRVEKHQNSFVIKTENSDGFIDVKMQKEMNELFMQDVYILGVMPGSLNYDGHSKRFVIED